VRAGRKNEGGKSTNHFEIVEKKKLSVLANFIIMRWVFIFARLGVRRRMFPVSTNVFATFFTPYHRHQTHFMIIFMILQRTTKFFFRSFMLALQKKSFVGFHHHGAKKQKMLKTLS
jgi:hypothetical protein